MASVARPSLSSALLSNFFSSSDTIFFKSLLSNFFSSSDTIFLNLGGGAKEKILARISSSVFRLPTIFVPASNVVVPGSSQLFPSRKRRRVTKQIQGLHIQPDGDIWPSRVKNKNFFHSFKSFNRVYNVANLIKGFFSLILGLYSILSNLKTKGSLS